MTIETLLFSRLTGFAGLTALIGAAPARLYLNIAPQNVARPYVAYRRVTAERPAAMGSDTGVGMWKECIIMVLCAYIGKVKTTRVCGYKIYN